MVDLRSRTAAKREVLDLLTSATRRHLAAGRARATRAGDPFKMPYQTIEAVLPVGGTELAIVNDTNFGSTGPQPVAAGLQRLHPRAGARAGGAAASAASPSCHSEKLISPHSCREWSSRRATCSSIRRVTAAGSK